jgi:hypothetical protein
MENTPKTFKELFANTGIEPTIDENGNTHYHFNAIRKKEHKEEPSEFEITPEFTYGKEVGKTIKIKATINSIETEQETLEKAAINCWAEGAWDNRDDFTDGFVEGAKSDVARDYWYEKFQKEVEDKTLHAMISIMQEYSIINEASVIQFHKEWIEQHKKK